MTITRRIEHRPEGRSPISNPDHRPFIRFIVEDDAGTTRFIQVGLAPEAVFPVVALDMGTGNRIEMELDIAQAETLNLALTSLIRRAKGGLLP